MVLTAEQRNAVLLQNNTLIEACPGSGKTRTLVAKLIHCLDEVRNTSRKIAIITYTNAGVYEIESRLKTYGATGDDHYCEISTIHSFCLNNILQRFYWRIPEYSSGFSVLAPDDSRYIGTANAVLTDRGLPLSLREYFELFNRQLDGTPITTGGLEHEIAIDFWSRLSLEGYIDFPNIIYYSYRILLSRPSLAYALACKFAWFLVDEFQDTSALQVEILRLVAGQNKSKFFLVGDLCQSIYGFAGARRDLMETFADEIGAIKDTSLLSNFRSSTNIINHAERLLSRTPAMCAGGINATYDFEPRYVHADAAIDVILQEFLPVIKDRGISFGETAILAPWWVKLLHIGRTLREEGIPVFGPGARPYKRNHVFAQLAEQVCAYLEQPRADIFYRIEKELFKMLNSINGNFNYSVYSYAGRKAIYRLIRCAKEVESNVNTGVEWLERTSILFSKLLIEEGFLLKSKAPILTESVENMKQDIQQRRIDPDSLSIPDLGMFANPDENIKLMTMHKAKGREFDAVAIVDLHEGRVPHFSAKTQEEFDEARRLFYVALTRARKVLFYITDQEDLRNRPSRFLGNKGLNLTS